MRNWTSNACSTWDMLQRWGGKPTGLASWEREIQRPAALDHSRILSYVVAASTIAIMLAGILAALFWVYPVSLPRVI